MPVLMGASILRLESNAKGGMIEAPKVPSGMLIGGVHSPLEGVWGLSQEVFDFSMWKWYILVDYGVS